MFIFYFSPPKNQLIFANFIKPLRNPTEIINLIIKLIKHRSISIKFTQKSKYIFKYLHFRATPSRACALSNSSRSHWPTAQPSHLTERNAIFYTNASRFPPPFPPNDISEQTRTTRTLRRCGGDERNKVTSQKKAQQLRKLRSTHSWSVKSSSFGAQGVEFEFAIAGDATSAQI